MRLVALLLAVLPVTAQDSSEPTVQRPGRVVTGREVDGELLCTVVVEGESLRRVLADLCGQLELELEGFEGVQRAALVTADMRDVSVDRVLEYLVGSVGLRSRVRTGSVRISEGKFDEATREELLLYAAAAYLEAHASHPGHPLAAAGKLNQGRIEEERGNLNAALAHYHGIAEDYQTSDSLPEALYRAGLVNEQLGDWGNSTLLFRQLINLATSHDFLASGRRELARCFVRIGEGRQALNTLDLLQRRYPAEDRRESFQRVSLRAEAHLEMGEYVECLRQLERLEEVGLGRDDVLEVQAQRARAFEGLLMAGEAGRAWLIYARGADLEEHTRALERAVRLALESSDELAVIFAVAQARTPELRERLAPYAAEARGRLGLTSPESAGTLTIKEKLDLADERAASGSFAEADLILESLLKRRDSFEDDLRVRLALSWAKSLQRSAGYEAAIAFLSEERKQAQQLSNRTLLDIRVAQLFEANDRYEEAIEAYEGRY